MGSAFPVGCARGLAASRLAAGGQSKPKAGGNAITTIAAHAA